MSWLPNLGLSSISSLSAGRRVPSTGSLLHGSGGSGSFQVGSTAAHSETSSQPGSSVLPGMSGTSTLLGESLPPTGLGDYSPHPEKSSIISSIVNDHIPLIFTPSDTQSHFDSDVQKFRAGKINDHASSAPRLGSLDTQWEVPKLRMGSVTTNVLESPRLGSFDVQLEIQKLRGGPLNANVLESPRPGSLDLQLEMQKMRGGSLKANVLESPRPGSLDVQLEIQKMRGGLLRETAPDPSQRQKLDLQSSRGLLSDSSVLSAASSPRLTLNKLPEDVFQKTEALEQKMENTQHHEISLKTQALEPKTENEKRDMSQSKLLADQISHLLNDISEMRSDIEGIARREDGLRDELASEIAQRHELERQIMDLANKQRDEVSLKTEALEEKTENKQHDVSQLKLLADQISHLLNDTSEMRNEIKGIALREDGLRDELASEIAQRHELERQILDLASKEEELISVMEMHAKEIQKVATTYADGKRDMEDAFERGLKTIYQSLEHGLEKGLEKEASQRSDQCLLATQAMRSAFEQHSRETDDNVKALHQETEKAFRQHAWDSREALQAQYREALEHMAIEKQLRDEGQQSMQDSLKALELQAARDTQKQIEEQAEALKALEQKLRADQDDHLKVIQQEREEAKHREEALQATHIVQARQLGDEGQQTMQDGLKALEVKLYRDMENQMRHQEEGLKDLQVKLDRDIANQMSNHADSSKGLEQKLRAEQAEVLKFLEQKLRAEQDDVFKVLEKEREETFRQHTKYVEEALQAQHREATEQIVQERRLGDEGQRTMQDGLKALEVKLCADMDNQMKNQAEVLQALEQKLRAERDDALKVIQQEREETFRQHTKDGQGALQAQRGTATEHMVQERQMGDEGQQTTHEGLKALEVKLYRDMENQMRNQAEGLKALEVKLNRDIENQMSNQAETSKGLEQKLRAEREDTLKMLRQEREDVFRQHAKDRQEALQIQHREAMERAERERQLRDEGQRTMEDGLRALQIKFHRDMDKQIKDLEQKLRSDVQRLAHEHSGKMKDVSEFVQATIKDLRNEFEKNLKSTSSHADTQKDTLEQRVEQLWKRVEGSLMETQAATQNLIAELQRDLAYEQASALEAQSTWRAELQSRQARLETLLNQSEGELRSHLKNISGIHDKNFEQTMEMVKSMDDHHNNLHTSTSQAMDVMHKNLQEGLAVLRSDMDNHQGSLREVLTEVTKQVDSLDASRQKEHLGHLRAEEKLERALRQLRIDVSDIVEEAHDALNICEI